MRGQDQLIPMEEGFSMNAMLEVAWQLSNFHKFSVCTIFHSREECPPACVSLTAAQDCLHSILIP